MVDNRGGACIYIYIYTYVYIYIYVHINICIYICIICIYDTCKKCVYICIYVFIHIHTYAHAVKNLCCPHVPWFSLFQVATSTCSLLSTHLYWLQEVTY